MEDLRIPKKDLELPKEKRDALPETKRAALPRNVRSVANVPDPSGHAPKRVAPPAHRLSEPDAPTAFAGIARADASRPPPHSPPKKKHLLPLHRHHRPEDPRPARPPSPPHVNPNVDTSAHAGGGRGGSDANASASSVATGHAGSADGLRNRLYNVRSDPSLADVPFDIWDDPTASAPFAGRIGGNLAFTSSKFRHPDSHKIRDLKELLDFPGFRDPLYIRAACIEGVGELGASSASGASAATTACRHCIPRNGN